MITVTVGSLNPAKIKAVNEAFQKVFSEKKIKIYPIAVNSKVSKQPMSNMEAIKGARNRAKQAIKKHKADYTIGLEAGLQKIGNIWFDGGWVVIIDKNGKESITATLKIQTHAKIIKRIKKGRELGDVIDELSGLKNSKKYLGHIGLVTKGAITRKDVFINAIVCCILQSRTNNYR